MNQKIIQLYDAYTHGRMDRRGFLERLTVLTGSVAAASAVLPLIEIDHAHAQTIAENDPRLATDTMSVTVSGVTVGGYVAKPRAGARHPAVLVIHENRGLTPHIRDVTRRVAVEGFLAYGIDALSPQGGAPADEDRGRELFARLNQDEVLGWLRAGVTALKARPDSTGKVGAIGFCWGGGMVNRLAATEPALDAGVAYYGRQVEAAAVPNIRAALLLHYAELDPGINAGIAAYEAALRQHNKSFELHMYPGVNHAFNNDTAGVRYNREAATLAWSRTIAFLRRTLGASA